MSKLSSTVGHSAGVQRIRELLDVGTNPRTYFVTRSGRSEALRAEETHRRVFSLSKW